MKKIFILLIMIFLFIACNDSGSKSSDTGFKITPDSITKFDSPATSFYTNLGDGNYAIIFNGPIDGVNYVGIALSDNPANETFNLKIYFQSDSISNITLIGGTSPGFKIIQKGAGDITETGTYNFSFSKNTVDTYTTYSIAVTGTGALTTNEPHITALYVGTNP